MALVAKTASAAAAANTAVSRSPAPQRGAPSTQHGQVEEVNPTPGATYDGSFSVAARDHQRGGYDQADSDGRGRGGYQQLPNPRTGYLDTTSQNFAALLETQVNYEMAAREAGGYATQKLGQVIGKVIKLYETNAEVISGTAQHRGESLSLVS